MIVFETIIDGQTIVAACMYPESVDIVTGIPNTPYWEVQAPDDKQYRGAWNLTNGVLGYDMAKAKVEAHELRRTKRAIDFAPHDAVIALNIPAQDSERAAAETARVTIRAADSALQTAIEDAVNINELKGVIV